jgi:ESCRT-II complex subunit VPS22
MTKSKRYDLYEQQANSKRINEYRDSLQKFSDKSAKQQVEVFVGKLKNFSNKYKNELKQDTKLRRNFMKMCSTLGVDPIQSEKTIFSSLFRIGEFNHQLSIKVLKFLFKEKRKGAKVVNLNDIKEGVLKTYTREDLSISLDDIKEALINLKPLQCEYQIIPRDGKTYVNVGGSDITNNILDVLNLAKGSGYFREGTGTSMNKTTFEESVQACIDQGLVWVDVHDGIISYCVCAFFEGFNKS